MNISPFYFQKGFSHFHGCTPLDVKRGGKIIKSFALLYVKPTLGEGTTREYKIERKPAFKVMGFSKNFSYERANTDVPQFWNKICGKEERPVKGMYGVCFDKEMDGNEFRYMIADDYDEEKAKGLYVHEIKEHTWAIFPCRCPMPLPLQEVNRRFFTEWLPSSSYEIAEDYNIEYYSNPEEFKNGTQDENYYACERKIGGISRAEKSALFAFSLSTILPFHFYL